MDRNQAMMKEYSVCMSVAGSDPSGGAGLQADLKTFTLLGCYGQAVPTALTVQNSLGVRDSVPVDAALVYQQMACAMQDLMPQAVKIGMLPNADVVKASSASSDDSKSCFRFSTSLHTLPSIHILQPHCTMSTEKALNNPATARRAHAKRQTNNDRRKALPT